MWISRRTYHKLCSSAFTNNGLFNTQLEIKELIEQLYEKVERMGAREDAQDARFGELLGLVRDGYRAQQVEIEALRIALSNSDQTAQQRVNEALDADSEHDADRKELANTALAELLGRSSSGGDPAPAPDPASTEPGSSTEVSPDVSDSANPNETPQQ